MPREKQIKFPYWYVWIDQPEYGFKKGDYLLTRGAFLDFCSTATISSWDIKKQRVKPGTLLHYSDIWNGKHPDNNQGLRRIDNDEFVKLYPHLPKAEKRYYEATYKALTRK